MPLALSGRLTTPFGDPLPNATIRFDAVRTSGAVLSYTNAEASTDSDGDYAISVEYGTYDIRVKTSQSFYTLATSVQINSDNTEQDLNALLVAFTGYETLTPQIILDFQALRDEAIAAMDAAAGSETAAADSASAAAASESNAAASEAAAADSETAASTSESNAASSETAAANSAAAAQSSETAASNSEGLAEQWATSDTLVDGNYYGARKYAVDAAASESAAAQSETNAAASEASAANSASAADSSANDAANSAASIDAADIVHAPGSGLGNEAGSAVFSDTGDFDPVGTATTKVNEHEAKSSAHTPSQVGADPAGAAQSAQDHAVQRANHTGTQLLSTISDAGTAAAKNTGTGAGDVPTISQADSRYAQLVAANDFSQMPTVGGDLIVESDSNDGGYWTRFSEGMQICSADGNNDHPNGTQVSGVYISDTVTQPYPQPFVGKVIGGIGYYPIGSGFWMGGKALDDDGGWRTVAYLNQSFATGAVGSYELTAIGPWK